MSSLINLVAVVIVLIFVFIVFPDIGFVFVVMSANLARISGSVFWSILFFLGLALMGLAANVYLIAAVYEWIVQITNCKYKILAVVILGLVFFVVDGVLTTPVRN